MAKKPVASKCERQTSPRTSTPRSSRGPEDLHDLAARLTGEAFVRVALPVGEEDEVTGPRRLEDLVQAREVRRAVDEGAHQVAGRPGGLPLVPGVEPRVGVAALGLGQQPLAWIHPASIPRAERFTRPVFVLARAG